MTPAQSKRSSRGESTPAAPTTDSHSGLQKSLAIIRKNVLLIIACLAAVMLGTLFWTLAQSKVYRAEVMLRLDPDPPKPLGQRVEIVSATGGSNYWNRREFYESEYKIIKSMRVATAVVRSLGLNADPSFMRNRSSREAFKPVSVEDAARVLISRLSVDPVKDSSLAFVHYEDTDPKRCQLILSTLVRIYLAQNLEGPAAVSATALEWLNGQLANLKTDLEKSEVALNDFRVKNQILSISLEDQHNIIAAELDQIAKEVTALEIKRAELSARLVELSSVKVDDPTSAGATELLQSQVLSNLRTSYAEQLRSVDELSANLGDEHPKVLAARAKLEATAKSMRAEITNIKSAAQRDLRAVTNQIAELKKKDQKIQDDAHGLQTFEIPFNQLQRTRNYNEKLYELVLQRARETDLTRVMNFNNVQIIDEATEPKVPVRPNLPLNLGLAGFSGLAIGIGLSLLRDFTDQSIKTPADVETMGVTCLGLIPEIEKAPTRRNTSRKPAVNLHDRDLIVAARPESGVAEAVRAIRTNLAFMSPDHPFRSLVITSAVPEEGKTTVAVSLATVLAQSGLRVLLVDTDMRRPRLHRTFRLSNDVGVTMAISGQASIDDCIRPTTIEHLDTMTSGPIPPNPSEILHSDKFAALTKTLFARYDRVIFDSPPVLPVTDAAILCQLTDGIVAVTRGHRTQKTALRQAIRMLRDVKGRILGVVLNAVDLNRQDYNEYHYYYRRDGYYSLNAKERADRHVTQMGDEAPPPPH